MSSCTPMVARSVACHLRCPPDCRKNSYVSRVAIRDRGCRSKRRLIGDRERGKIAPRVSAGEAPQRDQVLAHFLRRERRGGYGPRVPAITVSRGAPTQCGAATAALSRSVNGFCNGNSSARMSGISIVLADEAGGRLAPKLLLKDSDPFIRARRRGCRSPGCPEPRIPLSASQRLTPSVIRARRAGHRGMRPSLRSILGCDRATPARR